MPAYQNLVGTSSPPAQAPRAAFGGVPSGPYSAADQARINAAQQATRDEATRKQLADQNAIALERSGGAAAQQLAQLQQAQQERAAASNRQQQQERDMAAANQMNAVNAGGTSSGQYGYAYPAGGSGGSGGGGGSTTYGGGGQSARPAFDVNAAIQQFQQSMATPIAPPPQVSLPRTAAPQVPQASGMFAHAKDVSGRVGNKALEAFRNLMTKRGMSGSGMESEGEAGILGQVATQQAGAEYDQANLNNARQWEANQAGYQGDMGQSALGYRGAMDQNALGYQGALQQRSQGLDALMQLIQMGMRY